MDETDPDHQRPPEADHHFLHLCTEYVERQQYTKRLLDYFQPELDEDESRKFLLWGTAGVGKKQIAAHFLRKHARTMVKHILFVRAETFESFVLDFIEIYYTLTGRTNRDLAPKTLKSLLNRSKDALEDRPDDWLLVLDECFDYKRAQAMLESIHIADHLPHVGRTLIVSSSTVVATLESNVQQLFPSLHVGGESMQVLEMSEDEALEMLNKSIPVHLLPGQAPLDGRRLTNVFHDALGKVDYRPLTLSKVAGVCRTLRINLSPYLGLFRSKVRRYQPAIAHEDDLGNVPLTLAIALDISLDCLRNMNAHAVDILHYLHLLHFRQIDADYLWSLPRFARIGHQFTDALRTLADLSLIRMHVHERTGHRSIQIHSAVLQWLFAEMKNSDMEDYSRPMVELFGRELAVRGNREMFYHLLTHLKMIISQCSGIRCHSRGFLRLLIGMSSALCKEGSLFCTAERLLNQATTIATSHWTTLAAPGEVRDPGVILLHIEIMHLKSATASGLRRFLDAERELRAALLLAEDPLHEFSSSFRASMLRRLREDLTHCLHALQLYDDEWKCHQRIQRMSDQHHQGLQPAGSIRAVHRKYEMSTCLFHRGEYDEAFQMSSEVQRWIQHRGSLSDPFCQPWITFHAQLLFMRDQWKESFEIYARDSVNEYVDILEHGEHRYWEVAKFATRTLFELHEYEEQERLSLGLLENEQCNDLTGLAFQYFIQVVWLLSVTYQMTGRLLEADVLLRYLIERLEASHHPPDMINACRYDYIVCLLRQKRIDKGKEYRRQYQAEISKAEVSSERTVAYCLYQDERRFHIYCIALDRLRQGSTFDNDPFFEENRIELEIAGDRYGLLEDRICEDTDPRTDLDAIGMGAAGKSEVLDLLGVWDHSTDLKVPRVELLHAERVDMRGQRLMTDYFQICKCHRYRRGRYLNDDNFRH